MAGPPTVMTLSGLTALDLIADPIWIIADRRVLWANGAALQHWGIASLAEVSGQGAVDIVRPDTELNPIIFQGCDATLVHRRQVSAGGEPKASGPGADLLSIGAFACGLAHEINNPLAFVKLNLELAAEALPDTPYADTDAVHRFLDDAIDGAERVCQIVRDLYAFSRPDGARPEPVDLETALLSAIRLASAVTGHRAQITTTFASLSPVLGHPSRVSQLVLNLMINAAQALPETRPENRIEIETWIHDGETVGFSVRDNGRGMTSDEVALIFEPYFTTRSVVGGTGLGLYICRTIVAEMGGTITCSSQLGAGTTFRVTLPCIQPTLSSETEDRREERDDQSGLVLVVDDEDAILKVVASALAGTRSVRIAGSAERALELLDEGLQPAVVLCDVLMPNMTGPELKAALSQSGSPLADRFVFMTGGVFDDCEKTRAIGDSPLLNKPFSIAELKSMLADPARAKH